MIQQPLAEKIRPKILENFFGQDEIVGDGGWIKTTIASKKAFPVLFWGPPGCGKTTLARIYISSFEADAVQLHPATHGISDLKKILEDRNQHPLLSNRPLIIFVDEIHRWNKSQQDAFLPFVENGSIILVGATTENPSFCLNSALLSRMRVISFSHLSEETLHKILIRALSLDTQTKLSNDVKKFLVQNANGDGRYLLNMLETLQSLKSSQEIQISEVEKLLQKKSPLYDRSNEQHYNLISALHKSIRGSDPDAALYWICRMLNAGEDPQFIARRLLRMASEDIGLADPNAMQITISAWMSFERLGSKEGELCLAQAAVYLALAPKSNAIYKSFAQAKEIAEKTSFLPPPKKICNAPTKLMQELGYSKGYIYDHDTPSCFSGQNYFPDEMERMEFYDPVERGFEREMKKRKGYFSALRKKLKSDE